MGVMNPWEKLERILDSMAITTSPNVVVGVRKDGPAFRASLVGTFADGKPIESPCRKTPDDAIGCLYEMVLEMALKRFRPVARELKALGLDVPDPAQQERA
jgi:hypothetical protein